MTRSCGALLAAALAVAAPARAELPAVPLSYRIEATLDPASREMSGTETIRWENPTGATLASVPMHLYLNAFASEGTTLAREAADMLGISGRAGRHPDPWGWIRPLVIEQSGRAATWKYVRPDDGNVFDRTLAEIALPEPVPPGGTLELRIRWEARLPIVLARTGCTGDFCLVAQWFPKLGVIEAPGVRHAPAVRSAARQFHATTEFYADFADFDVTLVAPAGWLVGGTGREVVPPAAAGPGRVRHHYAQRAVHDAAFVVGRDLVDRTFTWRGIDVRYIEPRGTEHQVPRWRRATEAALELYGSRIGPYPYGTLTVVQVPANAIAAGGMEYPTFVTGAIGDPVWDHFPARGLLLGEDVVIHEVGHQWFYGLLASNEQMEAFLDEGFNTYWEYETVEATFGRGTSGGTLLGRRVDIADIAAAGLAQIAGEIREPVAKSPSSLYFDRTWEVQVYVRPAQILRTAARRFGQRAVDAAFALYFRRFAFRHPDFDDFLGCAREAGGADLATFLRAAFADPRLPDYRVASVSVRAWDAPRGFASGAPGAAAVTRADRAARAEELVDPIARESDGRVTVEITDPGHGVPDPADGAVTRHSVAPLRRPASPGFVRGGYHESRVALEGPGTTYLPVAVEFRFADGAVVRDEWDGRAPWRQYRFLRGAPLAEVRVDPDGLLAVDVTPENAARAVEPDARFAADWGTWLGAVATSIVTAVAQWL